MVSTARRRCPHIAQWQRRIGFHDRMVNGLPGFDSLKKLVGDRFGISHRIIQGPRQTYQGTHTLNLRTINMLQAAGHRLGANCTFVVSKGSYTGPDSASQGTHAGGGAVDISVRPENRCGRRIGKMVKALRKVGFAAWFRNWSGNEHIHASAISDPSMATEVTFPGWLDTRDQIASWAQGLDGLNTPGVAPMTRLPLQCGRSTSASSLVVELVLVALAGPGLGAEAALEAAGAHAGRRAARLRVAGAAALGRAVAVAARLDALGLALLLREVRRPRRVAEAALLVAAREVVQLVERAGLARRCRRPGRRPCAGGPARCRAAGRRARRRGPRPRRSAHDTRASGVGRTE